MGLEVKPSWKKYVDDSIAAIHPAKIKTGIYTGNGVDNHNIDIGVNLAAKSNVMIMLKVCDDDFEARWRIEYGQGDLSHSFHVQLSLVNYIQALTATGFQVGDTIQVNDNGKDFMYCAFWEE